MQQDESDDPGHADGQGVEQGGGGKVRTAAGGEKKRRQQ